MQWVRIEISDEGGGVNAGADLRLPSQLHLLGAGRVRKSFVIPKQRGHEERRESTKEVARSKVQAWCGARKTGKGRAGGEGKRGYS